MLKVSNLTKNYDSLTALDGLTLEIPSGRVGLLGPNGAGKTTFLKLAMGLLEPSAGWAEVLGYRVGPESLKLRRQIGYMPEHDCLPEDIRGIDFVVQMGRLSGLRKPEALQRAHEVLGYLRMGEERYRPVKQYSGGMRQKIKLAQALVHSPKLVLADEPTSGLDPLARDEMLTTLKELGKLMELNLILSTHLLHDVEALCDRVMIINEGRLVANTTVAEVLGKYSGRVNLHTDAPELMRQGLEQRGYEVRGRGEELAVVGPEEETMEAALEVAAKAGAGIRHLSKGTLSLEDLYLDMVAQDDREANHGS